MKNKVIIWGIKLEAEKILFSCKMKRIQCSYIIDSNEKGMFHGYIIKEFSTLDKLDAFCIVACTEYSTYKEIKKMLEEKGYFEFKDFIWSKLWDKKIVVINGNCHGTALRKYLEQSIEFNRKYAIYPIPEIYLNKEKEIDETILMNTDVYIHQDIRKSNKISERLSDEYIFSKLKDDAKKICIPNFVGYGNIYHQYCCEGGYVTRGDNPILLYFQDTLLDDIINCIKRKNEKLSLYSVMKLIKEKKFFNDTIFNNELERIKKREKNWDIKVSDFIEKHKYTLQLFNDLNHPGNILMKYICDETIQRLGCSIIDFDKFGMGAEVPSYLLLNKYSENIGLIRSDNPNISLTGEAFNGYEDYARQYIWLMYNEYLE